MNFSIQLTSINGIIINSLVSGIPNNNKSDVQDGQLLYVISIFILYKFLLTSFYVRQTQTISIEVFLQTYYFYKIYRRCDQIIIFHGINYVVRQFDSYLVFLNLSLIVQIVDS